MKKFLTLAFTALVFTAWSQPQAGPYAVITFFKVDQGKGSNYEKMERELWKPVHQARKKAGEIIGWYCYSIDFAGSGSEYNYVTVTVLESLSKLDNVDYASHFKAVFPKKPIEEISKATTDARVLVRSELARLVTNAAPEKPAAQPAALRHLRFFKADPGQEERYVNIVKGLTAPVYKEIVNQGKVPGWQFWEMRLPTGESASYNYVGVTAYNSYGEASQDNGWADAFKKVHPSLSDAETRNTVQSLRKEVKNEVWRLVDWVN